MLNKQCTISHVTSFHIIILRILDYTIEMYNWNQTENNNNIALSDFLFWLHQLLSCMCVSSKDEQGHQEETDSPIYISNWNKTEKTIQTNTF